MKKMAQHGDRLALPLDAWPAAVLDKNNDLEINRRFFGYAVRTDRWKPRDFQADWHIVYLIREGVVPGRAAGQAFQLEPGSLFWLAPGTEMDMTWPARLAFTEVWFRLQRGSRHVRFPEPLLVLPGADELWPTFRLIEDELTVERPLAATRLRCLIATLAIEVVRLQHDASDRQRLSPARCRRLTAYVAQHLTGRPTLADLAGAVDLSPDYFSRQFRRSFHMPPRDWLIQQRIREAARRLTTTDLTVYQVAAELGYENVSQFSRQFRQITGQSPARYRRTHGA